MSGTAPMCALPAPICCDRTISSAVESFARPSSAASSPSFALPTYPLPLPPLVPLLLAPGPLPPCEPFESRSAPGEPPKPESPCAPFGVSGRRSEEGGDFFFPGTSTGAEDWMSALRASSSTSQFPSPFPPRLPFSTPPSALTSSPSGMLERNSSSPTSSPKFHRSSRTPPASTAVAFFVALGMTSRGVDDTRSLPSPPRGDSSMRRCPNHPERGACKNAASARTRCYACGEVCDLSVEAAEARSDDLEHGYVRARRFLGARAPPEKGFIT